MELSRDKIKEIINDDWLLMDDCEGNKNCDVVKELARIALASLEAEPVAYIFKHPAGRLFWSLTDESNKGQSDVMPVYSAPPTPVSVPDERYQHLSELYHAQEKRLFKLAQRIKGSAFDKYAHSPSQAIDVLESALFGESDDTSRAAMLQGADGNSPAGWVACSERMPDKLIPVMVMYADGEMWSAIWTGTKWDDGTEFPDPHAVTHWQEMPAAPQQEAKNV